MTVDQRDTTRTTHTAPPSDTVLTPTRTTHTVLTPTLRGTARRWRYWVILGVVLVVVVIVGSLIAGGTRPLGVPLDPQSPGPAGAKALVEVLQGQGVEVELTHTLRDTHSSLDTSGRTTLVLHDRSQILDSDALDGLAGTADHLVLLDATWEVLDALAPGVTLGGAVGGVLSPDCSLPAADRAGDIEGQGSGYRHLGDQPAHTCYPSGDGITSLVQLDTPDGTVTVIGTDEALTNAHIAERGNAALALALLGEHPHLVWYVPGPVDAGTITMADLTPDWVAPVAVLLLLITIATAVWRGRRHGPLVSENLPVVVPAAETMEGRARLYARSSARLRALDSLRIGTLQRIAHRVRLPHTATVDEIIAAVSTTTGRHPSELRTLLLDTEPHSDRELIELADQLTRLDDDVTEATRR